MKVADQKKEKKMGSIRRRDVAIETAAMTMLEQGKVLTKKEFDMITKPTGVRSGNLMNLFGSWSRLVGFIEKDHPDIWAQLHGEKEEDSAIVEEPCPVCGEDCNCPPGECDCAKPDPLAALAKASEVKEDDE
jgi:hypothetical protein|tara:strand:- start:221 stop:616 length:396 start_codon:yes stop_codon:yes gene_type:complete